ncbi:MAG: tetratricopeptide repeat protein [Gammaproteobacteria bacterium]|nr:tetratricopeptide repeat protein [Gammaproteobacteria bacterium]MBT8111893.1 tetratricopeptide repeat protein [Gammaproteobacteria bacterium]NND46781.1 tetratricopeptide repeat protein [Woeseiaceae bacterium]NNL46592.1 tetratricopeptide repeat protein [Woeseiaceae bacterium]
MLLQRFTNTVRVSMSLLGLLVLAGCASGGPAKAPDSRAASGQGELAAGSQPEAVIPPKVRTLYEQAVSAMAAGDFVDAELRFKEFLLQFPSYPGAHVNLAIIHVNNGNSAAARSALDAALAINPGHAAALNQLGMLLRRNGNFLEAEAAYLKAVTVKPDYALAHYNLGVLNELYLQRLDVALQHFEAYQALVGEDKQVEKWIADLRRRVAAHQRTANVAD